MDKLLDVVQEEDIPLGNNEKSPRLPIFLEVPTCPPSNERKAEKLSPSIKLNGLVKTIYEKAFGSKGSPQGQTNLSPNSQNHIKSCKTSTPEATTPNNDSSEKKNQLTMMGRGFEKSKDFVKGIGARIRKNTNENL